MVASPLLLRLRERILAFAASRLQRDVAEDLAQEVLVVIHEKYGHLETIEDLLPLSLQIMRYKMMAAKRKIHRHGEHSQISVEDVPLRDRQPSQAESYERQQRIERIAAAMQQLGERCRRIMAWKLEGKQFPEIQQLLQAESINTVYTWDFRCRKQLLELLGGSYDSPVSAKKERLQ